MAKIFQLAPDIFDRAKFGSKPLTYPDRVRLTVEAIRNGTHAIFCGGWLSFNGEMGKGGWGRTGLREGEGNGLYARSGTPLGM